MERDAGQIKLQNVAVLITSLKAPDWLGQALVGDLNFWTQQYYDGRGIGAAAADLMLCEAARLSSVIAGGAAPIPL